LLDWTIPMAQESAGDHHVTDEVSDLKATANSHMRRDIEQSGKWLCECGACRQIRSLIGVDKMLDVWPLIRAIEQNNHRCECLADGPEKQRLIAQCLDLYDKLAAAMQS
jgi:hypothetical protein